MGQNRGKPELLGAPVKQRNLFLLCAALALAGGVSAQAGTVQRFKKVSEVSGVFPGGLDPNDQMGRAVIAAGDIDGDGNCDLVSGAIGDDDGGTLGIDSDTGALWVHFLNSNGGLLSNAKISATSGDFVVDLDTRDQFGRALAPLGDFDGDGVPDIAAAACRDDDGGVNRGALYLLYLNRDGSVKAQHKISDTQGNFHGGLEDLDEFGRAIANLGDLDGNGVIDLAVGAIGDDDGGVDQKGAVWILFLQADGTVLRHQKLSDTQGNFQGIIAGGDLFGFALANLGDVDADGVVDIAVGTPKDDDGGVRKGAVWILFLKRDGTCKGFKKISDVGGAFGLQFAGEFGSAMAGLGDLDGDLVPDMAVGAILEDGGATDTGTVWICFLNRDGSVRAKQKINDVLGGFTGNLAEGDWFGAALATMPDLDGNGILELVVGARFDDDGGINTGSLWILFENGVANVPPTPAFFVEPAVGLAPLDVQFRNRSSAGAHAFDWDFGDGAHATQREPNHRYTQAGFRTVTLTVSGPGGSATRVVERAVLAQQAAQATPRNGLGLNRVCFQSAALPRLGATWSGEVDASQHPGAGMTFLIGGNLPFGGLVTTAGEVLVRPPALGGLYLFRLAADSGGALAHFAAPLPNDAALVGTSLSTQALILGGNAVELCNAIDLVLGY